MPYLRAVKDPYDSLSPRHRWRFTWSKRALDRKLGGWAPGTLRSVKVMQRGVSPRIVRAKIVSSRGSTVVTGPQLRTRLGLFDTWAYFVGITSGQGERTQQSPSPPPPPANDNGGSSDGGLSDGGQTSAAASRVSRLLRLYPQDALVISGAVSPRPKHITLQQRTRKGWKDLGRGRTDRRGRYALIVPTAGTYRVLANGAVGPATHIR